MLRRILVKVEYFGINALFMKLMNYKSKTGKQEEGNDKFIKV